MMSRIVLGPASRRAFRRELPDPTGLRPEEQKPGEERRRIEHECDDDPVVAEAVEVRLDDEQDAAEECQKRRRE